MNVLFFSAMPVSPMRAGQTVYKSLEPPPPGHHVNYATERSSAVSAPPFADTSVSYFSETHLHLRGQRFGLIRRINRHLTIPGVHRQMRALLRHHEIDLLLACPQTDYDLAVSESLAAKGVRTAVWFMDDFYSGTAQEGTARRLWDRAEKRLVVSDAMKRKLQGRYGGDAHVVRYAADFDTEFPETANRDPGPLRLAYAGSLQPYYQHVLCAVMDAVSALAGRVTLDLFTPNPGGRAHLLSDHRWCAIHDTVPNTQLPDVLRGFDALLMPSSFRPEWRSLAETSLGSKIADYLASACPILFYGPAYAENIAYARRHQLGLIVDSERRADLCDALIRLANNLPAHQHLAKQAWEFGRMHHSRAANHAQMWAWLDETGTTGQREKRVSERPRISEQNAADYR
jgi:glycosyltransferase involved in cell wall biosynthesis